MNGKPIPQSVIDGALDLYAAGEKLAYIAHVYGWHDHSRAVKIIRQARLRGDPRATPHRPDLVRAAMVDPSALRHHPSSSPVSLDSAALQRAPSLLRA